MVTGVTNGTNTTTSAADYMKKTTGLNKDDFMKLFITQLKNQDPLQPQDSSAFVAQLAQMTQVEQAYNTNTNLLNLLNAMNNTSNMSTVAYIGKSVTAAGSQVNLAAGGTAQIGYGFDNGAANVEIGIRDSTGRTVRTLALGAVGSGEGSITWDGKDGSGNALPPGVYSFTVNGTMADGSAAGGAPLVTLVVDGVKMVQGQPVLTCGGVDVPLSSVISVKGAA
jgi:flagellar basal-body rod modification protein FlgD